MKEALINIVMLTGLDLFLIFVVSFITIMIMESQKLKKIRSKWHQLINDVWMHIDHLARVIGEDISYNWKGITLLAILIGVIWYIGAKVSNGTCELFTSVLGTFIGVIVIFIILRPRVRIVPELIDLTINGEKHLKVRVENLGVFSVNNIEVQLLYYWTTEKNGKEIKHTKQIELLRQGAPMLRGILPKGYDTTYGCVSSLTKEALKKERVLKLKEKEEKEYEGILCRVKATHAISGVTYVREHEFKKKEVDEFLNRIDHTKITNQ